MKDDNLSHNDSHHVHGDDGHDHAQPTPSPAILKVAFFLNLSFTIIVFIGGILTNSMTILAAAIYDLGDTFAIGSTLFLENYA